MKRFVLIDGHALLHRAFSALPPLRTKKGELVNAVFGFLNMLLKVISDLKPNFLAICLDRPAPTFRHKEYPQYQAQRPAMPKELREQIGKVRELMEAFGIPIYEKDGYEADDLIGSLARQAVRTQDLERKTKIDEMVIVTGDRDLFQLIGARVKVCVPKRGVSEPEIFDREKFWAKYGFAPEQLVDFKALVGDPSDNYPGVSGIGPKTAVKLIQKYGSLEEIYHHLEEIEPRVAEKLRKGEKWAFLSYKLARIERKAPVKLNWEKCRFEYNRRKVRKALEKLEFKTLIKRLEEAEKVGEQMGLGFKR